jgi:hypothetical protein
MTDLLLLREYMGALRADNATIYRVARAYIASRLGAGASGRVVDLAAFRRRIARRSANPKQSLDTIPVKDF